MTTAAGRYPSTDTLMKLTPPRLTQSRIAPTVSTGMRTIILANIHLSMHQCPHVTDMHTRIHLVRRTHTSTHTIREWYRREDGMSTAQ